MALSKENPGVNNISVDLARRILEACKQRARELRSPVSIAIVDAGGHLVLFERMMAPYGWATGNISIAKANTSVMFNQTTDAVAQWASSIPGFASSLSAMTDGKFIMAAGGWPIRLNGITIGGLGVSGGNAPGRDDDIARAGLSILAPVPQPVPVYTPPQALANQMAPTPVPDYNNRSAEYPVAAPMSDNNVHADLTDNTTSTNYLSDQENSKGASFEEPSSPNADLQQSSGDQS
jgi:uncharacterized protein GlcG (DUF336 family)